MVGQIGAGPALDIVSMGRIALLSLVCSHHRFCSVGAELNRRRQTGIRKQCKLGARLHAY